MVKKAAAFIFIGFLLSCQEEEHVVNQPPIAAFDVVDGTDRILLNGKLSTDINSDALTYRWSSAEGTVTFGNGNYAETYFKIPEGPDEKLVDITLTVNDGKSEDIKTQTVTVPGFSRVRAYGLGKNLHEEISNDVPYEWYYDQANTGELSAVNCGPTAVTMAIKWFNENFTHTPQEARDIYHSSGGWWFTDDIIGYLNKYSVSNYVIALDNVTAISHEIDDGNIVILCVDMYYVKYLNDPDYHINKFYSTNDTGWGHFMVIKGYKNVDGRVYYEAYDPYSMNNSYLDGALKGQDRYYLSSDLDKATNFWWDYAIVVDKSESTGGRKRVNVEDIVHRAGR